MSPEFAEWAPYCGRGPAPEDWLARWNTDPLLIGALGLGLGLVLWALQGRRRLFGACAILTLAVIFVSPLCALSSALFTARTLHHVLLVAAAAPLLAAALPRRRAGPLALAAAVQAAVLWFWHAPAAYSQALSYDGVYWLMQLSLFAASIWFWSAIRAASAPAAVAALLFAMIAMGLLGALLTFASTALYAPHLLTTAAWGLSPLADQQLAGLFMSAPAAAIYLAAALFLLARRLRPDLPESVAPA